MQHVASCYDSSREHAKLAKRALTKKLVFNWLGQAGDMIMLQTGEFCGLAGSAGASAAAVLYLRV